MLRRQSLGRNARRAGLTLLCCLLAGQAWSGQDRSALVRGKAYFEGFGCMRCHRVGEEGGKLAPDLSFVGFRKSRAWLNKWLKDPSAWKHGTIMPNFHLPEHVRQDLVEYLSSLKGQAFEISDYPPWNKRSLLADPAKRGEAIFERAGCVGCHGKAGHGGYPNNNVAGEKIPALTSVADGYTKGELKEKIRRGVKPMKADPNGPEPLIFMPPWGQVLQENELDHLVEYLFSLRPKRTAKDEW